MKGRFSNKWVTPRVVLASDEVVQANRQCVAEFASEHSFLVTMMAIRTELISNVTKLCRDVPCVAAMEKFLVRMRITGTTDSQEQNTGLLLQLARALEESTKTRSCTIYRMSPFKIRRRSIDNNNEITDCSKGAAPVYPRERRGEIYPRRQSYP